MTIESLLAQGLSCRSIAWQLAVATSTVTREVSRNRCGLGPAVHSHGACGQASLFPELSVSHETIYAAI